MKGDFLIMKKALKFSTIMLLAILAGVFLVTSCSSPTDGINGETGLRGPEGPQGKPGGYYVSNATIDAATLALFFDRAGSDAVVLANNGNVTISGTAVIPGGKILRVATPNTASVTVTGTLDVIGTLEITEGALLIADSVGSAGYLTGNAANISGPGFVSLPVVLDNTDVGDGITYADVADISVAGSTVYTASGASSPQEPL
jgi:hypothetical protein